MQEIPTNSENKFFSPQSRPIEAEAQQNITQRSIDDNIQSGMYLTNLKFESIKQEPEQDDKFLSLNSRVIDSQGTPNPSEKKKYSHHYSFTKYHQPYIQMQRQGREAMIASYNLERIQEFMVVLQSLEVQNQEIDNIFLDLQQFNESLISDKEYHENEQFGQETVQITSLAGRNQIQNQQIKELFEFNQKISQQNTSLKVQIIELETQADSLNQQIQLLENEAQNLGSDKQQIIEEFSQVYELINNQFSSQPFTGPNNLYHLINQKLQQHNDEKYNLQKQIEGMLQDIDEQQRLYDQLLQENNELVSQISVQRQEIEDFQEQIKNTNLQFDDLKQQLNDQQTQQEQLEISNENLQNMYNKLADDQHNLNRMTEETIRCKDMEIYKISVEKEKFQRTLAQKEQMLQDIKSEFHGILNQAEQSFSAEKRRVQLNLEELQAQFMGAQSEIEQYQNINQRLEIENKDNKQRISQLELQYQATLNQQSINHDQLVNQLQLEKSLNSQKQKSKREQLELENFKLNKVNIELHIKVTALEHQKKEYKEQLKQKSFDLESIKLQTIPQVEHIKKQLTANETQLSKLKQNENELEHRVMVLENEKQDLELVVKRQRKLLNQI